MAILPIFSDSDDKRGRIHKKAIEGMGSLFPIIGNKYDLDISDLSVDPKSYSMKQYKDAILAGKSLTEPLTATVIMKDKSGKVIDRQKNYSLAKLPYMTDHHTFIVKGNSYSVANQLRTKSGIYTRIRKNEVPEVAFNLSKGSNFKVTMDPSSSVFKMELGTSSIPLYPILKAIGVSDKNMKNKWGEEVLDKNSGISKTDIESAITKLYTKVVPFREKSDEDDHESRLQKVKMYFKETRVDPNTTLKTLGRGYSHVGGTAMLDASNKLMQVFKHEVDFDDRDSLEFQTAHSVDDFMKERLVKSSRDLSSKFKFRMDQKKNITGIRDVLGTHPMNKPIESLITQFSLSRTPDQINPLEIMDAAMKVTRLGDGGIGTIRAIPEATRDLHTSHLGILDPVRSPECYDELTEVFTLSGWKFWKDISKGDMLACRINDVLEFHHPRKLFKSYYSGTMIGAKTGKIDFLVTPNHRMFVRPMESKVDAWRIELAEKSFDKPRTYCTSHQSYRGDYDSQYFYLKKIPKLSNATKLIDRIDILDWAEFVGWALTEGCVYINENVKKFGLSITQCRKTYPKFCKNLDSLAERLPWAITINNNVKGKPNLRIYTTSRKQVVMYFKNQGTSFTKFIPEEFFHMAPEVREKLMESMLFGDGRNHTKQKGKVLPAQVFTTTSPQLAKDFDRLAIGLGRSTTTRKDVDNRKESYNDCYEVRILRPRNRSTRRINNGAYRKGERDYYKEEYSGYVYCAEVPGSLLLVRRKRGIPIWLGNSSTIGVDVRFAMGTAKDDEGNLYSLVRDMKTGKVKHMSADYLRKKVLAFPGQKTLSKLEVMKDGRIQTLPRGSVDYEIANTNSMFGPSAALLPFVDNMQGNRALMGAKQITQALPLVYREKPMIQVGAPDGSNYNSMEEMLGSQIIKSAPEKGKITRVDDEFIHFKGVSGKKYKISYANDYPLNSKTYMHEDIVVKVNKTVAKGTPLTESNFTKDGDIALGINARVGYMAYHGDNTNDAVVISESAAKKLTSQHMYKKLIEEDAEIKTGKKFWLTQFPNKHTMTQLGNIDGEGLPVKGSRVNYGDPIILATRKASLTANDIMLGKLNTDFRTKFRDAAVTWDKEHPGVITDVVKTGKRVQVTVKMDAPMLVGDKLSNKYGNKSVVSKIVPDDQMIKDESGNTVDILMAPTGVVSRINPGQLLENALGKVAEKTGKKIVVTNFDPQDRIKTVKKILKKHGISEMETVFDPMTGKKIKNINVGKQQIMKLFKSTDTNFGSRGLGTYDINQQPVRGGSSGSKRIGGMELNALLAHGATSVISESSRLKSQKNDEWWNAYKLGLPLPALKRTFAADKMVGMLAGAGIKVNEHNDQAQLSALTDADITKMSNGTISSESVLRKKDLKPEIGGLFDPVKTGGMEGEKWADITLSEPIVRPAFIKPAASMLGISSTKLQDIMYTSGGKHVSNLLKAVDMVKLKKKTINETEVATGQKLNNAVRRLKYIRGLESMNLTPNEAYTGKKLAILPPKMRPIVPGPNGQLLVADANHLYRDVILADNSLKRMKSEGFTESEDLAELRSELSNSVSALAGLSEPNSYKLRQQGKKGFIKQISGPKPSAGYYQEKLYGRPQDLSGRGTIAPDPTLRMDEIGLPEDTAWGMYQPFVTKRMVRMGYNPIDAAKHIEDRTPVARRSLIAETEDRPVIFNRAPTLWRYGMLGAYPKLVPGKTIRMSPFTENALNSDYDGDSVQLHVPASAGAVQDVKNMTLDKILFSDKTKNDLLAKPEMEAVSGLYESTRLKASGRSFKFKNKDEAMKAYYAGTLKSNDNVEIG